MLEHESDIDVKFKLREFFEAAETSSMVSDEAIPYSQSLEKLNAIEAGIRYAERTFYAKGREEGLLEAREEGFIEGRNESIRIMASLGIPAEIIASKFGMSKHDVDRIIRSKA